MSISGVSGSPNGRRSSGSLPPKDSEDVKTASGFVQTYARVRPWIDKEGTIPAEGQIVARPVLAVDPNQPDALIILDPVFKFKPKKEFVFSSVFWAPPDGSDDGETVPVATQDSVHRCIGVKMAESVCGGHSTACVVCGDSKTGKGLTLFGDLSGRQPENRGLVPRFAEEVFDQIAKTRPPNSKTVVELEIIDVEDGNAMVDLLSGKSGKPSSARGAPSEDVLKIREDSSTVAVQGLTKAVAEDAAAVVQLIRQGLMRAKKRGGFGHVLITIRFTETLTFNDPSDPEEGVTKQGKCQAQFLLLSGRPTAFFRCVDAASQKDKNETVKVPTRESTLTRLMREFFGGNCAGHMVCCVSPFFGYLKETLTMLDMTSKMKGVKWTAKTDFDQQTNQFRKLDDEVKKLKRKLSQSEQAQSVVQTELNRRQSLLEDVVTRNGEHNEMLQGAKESESAELAGVAVQSVRFKRQDESYLLKQQCVGMEINDAANRCEALGQEAAGYEAELKAVEQRTAAENTKVQHFLDEESDLVRKIAEYERRRKDCEECVRLAEAEAAEQSRAEEDEIEMLQRELEEVNILLDKAEVEEKEAAAPLVAAEEQFHAATEPQRDLEEAEGKKRVLQEEEEKLREEIAQLEADIEQLERANKVDVGCCVIA